MEWAQQEGEAVLQGVEYEADELLFAEEADLVWDCQKQKNFRKIHPRAPEEEQYKPDRGP